GIVAALLLALAGVPRATIVADYVLTDECLAADRDEFLRTATGDPAQVAADLEGWRARPEKIEGMLDRLEAHAGPQPYRPAPARGGGGRAGWGRPPRRGRSLSGATAAPRRALDPRPDESTVLELDPVVPAVRITVRALFPPAHRGSPSPQLAPGRGPQYQL